MPNVALALMWHQHQPYYPDDVAGETLMPWVRLHGTKDYVGMALHLLEVPEFHCTINLVPSLLVQLQAYVEGASDRHLDVSRMPADGLDRAETLYLLENFFMACPDTMIRPHPRYAELFQMRGVGSESSEQALHRFRERDIRDLQVWSNLAWFHPLLFETDPELAEFREKGRRYTEEDKLWLLEKQRAILARIIPLHRHLAESGQVELTTTPFYHPILPLLFDKRLAREAMPDVNLPSFRDGYPEDAEVHVRRAVASHEKWFGARPTGMWPSEGSVCPAMLPLLARNGIEWIATDEEILAHSTNHRVGRDDRGHVRHAELLYRPWLAGDEGAEVAIVFRDHALSDQIGFHYQRSPGPAAAGDFLGKLHAIGHACQGNPSTLVSVILDGENCWEYYPDGGVSFLRSLYQSIAREQGVRSTTVGEHLRRHPPNDRVPRLFSGSWINHNFAIWIGHEEDNKAWDALHDAREFLRGMTAEAQVKPATLERAWEELYIAEGSDWFWWYGEDHSCALDALFDELFRKHLKNIYTLLGHDPPGTLFAPISRAAGTAHRHEQPAGFLRVNIDGRTSYFEWLAGARYVCGSDRGGAMTQVAKGLFRQVYFGFSLDRLLIRVDAAAGPARDQFADVDTLRIGFVEPAEFEIVLDDPSRPRPVGTIRHEGEPSSNGTTVDAATDQVLELGVPFGRLGLKAGDSIKFYVEALRRENSLDRAPREGVFELTVPHPDFERVMWHA